MTASVVDAKRAYYKSLGIEGTAVAELEAKYYEGAASGAVPAAPLASETVAGLVKKADFVAVPPSFADLDEVRTWAAALNAALIAAGIESAS